MTGAKAVHAHDAEYSNLTVRRFGVYLSYTTYRRLLTVTCRLVGYLIATVDVTHQKSTAHLPANSHGLRSFRGLDRESSTARIDTPIAAPLLQ